MSEVCFLAAHLTQWNGHRGVCGADWVSEVVREKAHLTQKGLPPHSDWAERKTRRGENAPKTGTIGAKMLAGFG